MPARTWLRRLVWILTGALMLSAFGCGGARLISKDQEISIGRDAGDQFERRNGGLVRDAEVLALVEPIARRVTEAAQPPQYPYDVRVLNNSTVNAVAFPGGRLYLYRGLIEHFERDPHKIAWVVGHEAAHVSRQHAVRVIERQLGYDLLIALVLRSGDLPKIAGMVSDLMLLSYSRENEFEADRMGMLYAHAAGYDPSASIGVMKAFQEIQRREPTDFEIYFMTHPGQTARIDHSKRYLEEQGWEGQWFSPQE